MRFCQLSLLAVIFAGGMSAIIAAQSPVDHPKVVIEEVELEDSLLPKAAQEQLVSSLKEREWEEGSQWVADLENIVIRAEQEGWPDRENQGYGGFSVGASWKPVWRELGLLHVQVTVNVSEGQPKRVEKIEFRWVNEHLGPLQRYLAGQVGRPWDKVFADICRHLDRGSAVQDHVRDHLPDYVATCVIVEGGELRHGNGYGIGRPLRTTRFFSRSSSRSNRPSRSRPAPPAPLPPWLPKAT